MFIFANSTVFAPKFGNLENLSVSQDAPSALFFYKDESLIGSRVIDINIFSSHLKVEIK